MRGQLVLALHRCGRQAEALERYREGRHTLVEELGLEPGRQLRELEQAILRQDPELDGPRTVPEEGVRRAPVAREPVRVRWLVAAGAVLVAAVVAAALLAGGGRGAPVLLGADAVAAVDPGTRTIATTVRVPGSPDRLAVSHGTLWAIGDASHTLTAIDTHRRSVQHVAAPGGMPSDLAGDAAGVWVLDEQRRPSGG
jgi:hypothetical protein